MHYASALPADGAPAPRDRNCATITCVTLLEITFELQRTLTPEQLRQLGAFSNTYGLRRFRVDAAKNRLSFEYDASRLDAAQVSHVLAMGGIPVARRVDGVAA